MKIENFIASILIILCAEFSAFSQIIHRDELPLGIDEALQKSGYIDLNISMAESQELRNRITGKDGPLEFAISREYSLTPYNSGYIKKVSDTEHIWYLGIREEEAYSLNVIFSAYRLAEGESLFLYNADMSSVLGPLCNLNNKSSGILATSPLSGSKLIIEYHFNPQNQGELELGKISADILGVFAGSDSSKDGYYGISGPCNIDINCSEGLEWQTEKRAVIRILAGGNMLGTAVLLNNTNQENIAYALTALHVAEDQSDASSSVFVFRYESPWCNGPDASVNYSVSGAELVAQNSDFDFSLLRLSEFPPILFKPYLAGWRATSAIPESSVCIHHPGGDVKKISIDNDAPEIDSFKQYHTDAFWHILQWDVGTTEEGSSGSPLFDQDHLVIGHLSGGEAMCGRSVNDYYARFDLCYNYSSDIYKSLRPWLDPAVSGCTFLEGRDPFEENFADSDTIYNGAGDNYTVREYITPGNGYSTGINSDSILAYAGKFTIDGNMDLTELRMFVAKSNYQDPDDIVTVMIHNDDMGPGNIIASKTISLSLVKDDYLLYVDFDSPVAVSGDIWVSYTNKYYLAAAAETRQFAVYKEDKVSPGSEHAWFMDKSGWKPFSQHPFDASEISLAISIVCVSNSAVNPVNKLIEDKPYISVYPVPTRSELNIDSDIYIERIEILDTKGHLHASYLVKSKSGISLQLPDNLKPGVYFVKFYSKESSWVKSIIKTFDR